MTVYVDMLMDHGAHWGKSCHMFCDSLDLAQLHAVAGQIAVKLWWLDVKRPDFPHYDLNARRRGFAIELGVVAIDSKSKFIPIFHKVIAMHREHLGMPQRKPA